MPDHPTLSDAALVMLAFLTRSGAFLCLLLCWRFFRQAEGPLVPAFRTVFAAFSFLLGWVWIASVTELVADDMRGASAVVEYSASFIFVPNMVIFIALLRLLVKLHHTRRGQL